MNAIILNAGKGSRLSKYTNNTHKCLLNVGGKKIIDYQLESLKYAGIKNITIVVGYLKEQIKEYVSKYKDFEFNFVENPNYANTNTAFSLRLAKGMLYYDTIYLNGDVVFPKELIKRLIDSEYENALAVDYKECGEEEVKVELSGNRITRIGKDIPLNLSKGEFIGIAKFSKNMSDKFVQSLDNTIEKEMLYKVFFEHSLQQIINDVELMAVDVTQMQAVEIDFEEDLLKAIEIYKD